MTRVLYAGSDVREPVGLADADWDSARRETYLLRTDVARPISVDRMVWRPHPSAETPLVDDPLPWISIEETAERTRKSGGDAAQCAVVAIGLVAESEEEERFAAESSGIAAELEVQPAWTLLGFDVADGSTSGLSNCGYEADEGLDRFRVTWGWRLNAVGLFTELADAFAFRAVTDQRVPEHAPFRVYGLWLVP